MSETTAPELSAIPVLVPEPTPTVTPTPVPSCTPAPTPTPTASPPPTVQFIITDNSGAKYVAVREHIENVIGPVLVYRGDNQWGRGFESAFRFNDGQAAITEAKRLALECPVKVYAVQINGNQVGIGEVQYT